MCSFMPPSIGQWILLRASDLNPMRETMVWWVRGEKLQTSLLFSLPFSACKPRGSDVTGHRHFWSASLGAAISISSRHSNTLDARTLCYGLVRRPDRAKHRVQKVWTSLGELWVHMMMDCVCASFGNLLHVRTAEGMEYSIYHLSCSECKSQDLIVFQEK